MHNECTQAVARVEIVVHILMESLGAFPLFDIDHCVQIACGSKRKRAERFPVAQGIQMIRVCEETAVSIGSVSGAVEPLDVSPDISILSPQPTHFA